MTKIAKLAMCWGVALLASQPAAGPAFAGQAPDEKLCGNPAALAAADPATQGGCIATHRRKGNCQACHLITGVPSGDIAPPLAFMTQRFPDKAKLRAQVDDARQANPDTVMPPFGAHRILTADEIDKVVEFLLTL